MQAKSCGAKNSVIDGVPVKKAIKSNLKFAPICKMITFNISVCK